MTLCYTNVLPAVAAAAALRMEEVLAGGDSQGGGEGGCLGWLSAGVIAGADP
jgi:hypothetical protein